MVIGCNKSIGEKEESYVFYAWDETDVRLSQFWTYCGMQHVDLGYSLCRRCAQRAGLIW